MPIPKERKMYAEMLYTRHTTVNERAHWKMSFRNKKYDKVQRRSKISDTLQKFGCEKISPLKNVFYFFRSSFIFNLLFINSSDL